MGSNLTESEEKEIRELLAEVSHEIWGHWMKYLFSISKMVPGGTLIPFTSEQHGKRQLNTPYTGLTEREKDSDREQADKIIKVFGDYLGWGMT